MTSKGGGGRRRGRPPGRTARGEETRARLYEVATSMFAAQGYEATTMRGIASAAGVSPGLLYKYFPSKAAVVLALYDELSQAYAEAARPLPQGGWVTRALYALTLSLDTLAPHRGALKALLPVLVADPAQGLFGAETTASRRAVEAIFLEAVSGAYDAPKGSEAALGQLLYLGQLTVILLWLLDQSPDGDGVDALLGWMQRAAPWAALALNLPPARVMVDELAEITHQLLWRDT